MSAPTTDPVSSRSPRFAGLGWALALDLLVILVFAAIGRRNHDEGDAITRVLHTAWPFLVAGGMGHLINLALIRRAPSSLGAGLAIWATAVAGGMVLRQVSGDGTAFSFIVVATIFTGTFMLGWRAVAAWRGARHAR